MMNETRRLFELQSVDLKIRDWQTAIEQLTKQIGDNSVILKAKDDLGNLEEQLKGYRTKHRDLEYELDRLQGSIKKLSEKLYGGKVGNPKELMSIEQEVGNFKSEMAQKEDEMLELMTEEEALHNNVKGQSGQVMTLEQDWQKEQGVLIEKKDELEKQLAEMMNNRQQLASGIDSRTLAIYDSLRSRKGEAVARVEQGRCQGCRLTLPVNEWQRVRSGTLVQCSSCSKILFLE
jgi:predicted  nucleic acid-binding Zn-ribbon protein